MTGMILTADIGVHAPSLLADLVTSPWGWALFGAAALETFLVMAAIRWVWRRVGAWHERRRQDDRRTDPRPGPD
jgi:hypothetical protein